MTLSGTRRGKTRSNVKLQDKRELEQKETMISVNVKYITRLLKGIVEVH